METCNGRQDLAPARGRRADWQPGVDAANIGVAVDDGVVALTGHVPNYV